MTTIPDLSAVPHRFLRGLAVAPGRPALRTAEGVLTYTELHERALCVAAGLRERAGGAPGAVAVFGGKVLADYVGLLGVLYAGGTAVPLNPRFPAARLAAMVEAAGVRFGVSQVEGVDVELVPPAEVPMGRPVDVGDEDIAYVLFTSGSTGAPKGVKISHGALAHYFALCDQRYDFGPEDVLSQTFDLNFDCAAFDLFAAWGAGACVRPVPGAAYRDLPGFVAAEGITVWFSTPSAIAVARRHGLGSLPGLRWSLFAGEALKVADAVDWLAAAPGTTLENIYGPTELTITVSAYRWTTATPTEAVNGIVPIGRVHDGHDHLLLAPDGAEHPDEGELCVAGPQITPGYLDPAHTEGRFLHRAGRTWYRTGDRVRRIGPAGLAYLGRGDSQVQIQGWRVELPELEQAARAHPAVEDAVAVVREGPIGLELVVFHTGAPVAAADLARHLRTLLPDAMVPRTMHHLDAFPLNPNRKIDRGELARRAEAV